jgi:hypothetical protein
LLAKEALHNYYYYIKYKIYTIFHVKARNIIRRGKRGQATFLRIGGEAFILDSGNAEKEEWILSNTGITEKSASLLDRGEKKGYF